MTSRRALTPRALVTWAVVALALFSLPTLQGVFDFPVYNLIFLYLLFFWIAQASSWNLFSGYSGYFSFGQGAFYGAGMYTTAILGTRYGWTLLPTLPVAAMVGAAIALVTAFLVFRLRRLSGEIFALFTLAVALGIGALVNNWNALDGGRGIPLGQIPWPSFLGDTTQMLYYLGLLIALGAVFTAYVIQHNRFGAGLFAIRDDEKVAEAIGVPTLRYKVGVFAINGLIAGISGGLHAVQVNFVSVSGTFNLRIPVFVILMSVVGGRRHWFGPVLGALVIFTVNDRMSGGGMAELSLIVLAIVLIAATLFLKGGISTRLLERPVPPMVALAVVTVLSIVFTDSTVITAFAYGMVAALVVLFLPAGLVPGGRGGTPPPGAAASPAVAHEHTTAQEAG
ncbi:MAG TPA: branched-chain amino acid ABC transporter permease [Egicoccus sp.]|nr:branched-chain amino acid ABC transporter permease [Egicoccus sp.]HSK23041.1 branched-chain amino acid ABC transporter permease [Egicoccus sp.]